MVPAKVNVIEYDGMYNRKSKVENDHDGHRGQKITGMVFKLCKCIDVKLYISIILLCFHFSIFPDLIGCTGVF